MTNDDALTIVTQVVQEHLGVSETIEPNVNLYDEGADDLDLLEILMILEEMFGCEFADGDYETINDYIALIIDLEVPE